MSSRTATDRGQRPTIIDVARRAGVSKSLVSLALAGRPGVSESSRERILEAAREIGYSSNTWARSLVRGRTQLIGVITTDLANSYHTEIATAVEDRAMADGYGVLLGHGRRDPDLLADRVDQMLGLGVDGLVVVSSRVPEQRLAAAAGRRPLVVVGRPETAPEQADLIHNDDDAGARLAVAHLRELGHERIAYVAMSRRAAMRAREQAYREAVREAGLEYERVEPWGEHVLDTLMGTGDGMRAEADVTSTPTAVFVSNDRGAASVLGAAVDAGITVPGELSVVGYDNTALASAIRPALTSVDQPTARMGELAVEMLLERIGGRTEPRHEVVTPTLAVRTSTAAPQSPGS